MSTNLPAKFALFNASTVKNVVVAVEIAGVPTLGSGTLFAAVRYGDPGLVYGQPGLVYGQLLPVSGVFPYLDLNSSSLTIQQKIEPEQGRGSVTQLTLSFTDVNGYMTKVVSPGVIVDEILGREVNVFLGYQEISYPEDFYRIYRGYISAVDAVPGGIRITVSDPNFKRRQDIFFSATTMLNGAINNSQTAITVDASGDFFQQILGPDGTYDTSVRTFIQIEDEFLEYGPTGITSPTSFLATRAARNTVAVAHADNTAVAAGLELTGNAVDLALKIMLSGWGGPWITGVTAASFVNTMDGVLGNVPGAIVLSGKGDAKKDFGLVIGDQVIVAGGANPGNYNIVRFLDSGGITNHIIVVNAPLVVETPAIGTLSFRSKYDTLPIDAGSRLTPKDVDVDRHEFFRNTFLFDTSDQFRFFINAQENGKTFIESKIYLPLGAYSVTRNGRLSMGITRPPIADQQLLILDENNVLNPEAIRPNRSTNQRKFWNDIIFNYEFDDTGTATQVKRVTDLDSYQLIGIAATLTIDAPGARTAFNADAFFAKRAQLLLSRFSRAAMQIPVKANWGIGNQIEAGDVIAIRDNGTLQIPNFNTGLRDLGFQLFEVIDRSLSIKDANVQLTVISGIGSEATDRYGTIAPSTVVGTGSTTTQIAITDSFNTSTPGDEASKWETYIGNHLQIHDPNFVTVYDTILRGIDPVSGAYIIVDAVGAPPTAGMIIDLHPYSTDPSLTNDIESKTIHAFLSPDVTIVSGISNTQFTVGAGDVSKFRAGFPITVHNADFSIASPETVVDSVVGVTITVKDSLGFTPAAGQTASMLGFDDGRACYRYL